MSGIKKLGYEHFCPTFALAMDFSCGGHTEVYLKDFKKHNHLD